jgi:2-keto-4-pentenoate hydratase/2-oxohepta-3-ene-1,7-dioic acid hydratase in catechol pathway
MKLLRYGERGAEKPGILDPEGVVRDLSGVVKDIAGEALGPEGLKRIEELDLGSLPAVKGPPRLGPPIATVPKFLGIGLNYRDHAEETGMPIPEAPIVFAKATSCISGPNDPILMPKGWQRIDFEVELAFAIGSVARNVTEAAALSYVAGYMIADDVSERSLQKGGPRRMDQGEKL